MSVVYKRNHNHTTVDEGVHAGDVQDSTQPERQCTVCATQQLYRLIPIETHTIHTSNCSGMHFRIPGLALCRRPRVAHVLVAVRSNAA